MSRAEYLKLGDTSFRRKEVAETYRALLVVLAEIQELEWRDRNVQAAFLTRARQAGILEGNNVQPDRWARTATNGLVAIGLCTEERQLTPAGRRLISTINENEVDNAEKFLELSGPSAVFLRQLLKLQVETNQNEKVYPFRLLISLIVNRGSLNRDEFTTVIGGILDVNDWSPIEMYMSGLTDHTLLEAFDLSTKSRREYSRGEQEYLATGVPTVAAFKNRKSAMYVQPILDFVLAIQKFNADPSVLTYREILSCLRNSSVSAPFKISSTFPKELRRPEKWAEFLEQVDNPFVSTDAFTLRQNILRVFKEGKSSKNRREYADLNLRVFKASGVLSTLGGNISVPGGQKFEFFKAFSNQVGFRVTQEQYDFGSSDGFEGMFGNEILINAQNALQTQFGVSGEALETKLLELDLAKARDFVLSKFPREELVDLFRLVEENSDRSRKLLHERVTEEATIPTIFEYLVGLAWSHFTNFAFSIRDAFGLSLDADMLPLTHAPGNRGDVEIDMGDFAILLEATLMDPSNQRRSELEPVLRHSVNLERRLNVPTYTFFVANAIDPNVSRIFRFASLMDLRSTQNEECYASPRIVSFTSNELADVLSDGIDWAAIESSFEQEFENTDIEHLNSEWRQGFISNLK